MQKARGLQSVRQLDVIHYRREAEQNVSSDDHLYRFDWVSLLPASFSSETTEWGTPQDAQAKALNIRLMSTRDPSVDGGNGPRQRWREYVDSYVTRYPTEWLPRLKNEDDHNRSKSKLFLRR